jgi:hypothetical protein
MLNRRHYLILFVLLLAGVGILMVMKRSTDGSDTSPATESKQAISSNHAESNPAGVVALPEVSVDSAHKKISPNPKIGRYIDWDKYPGTLDGQIHRALDNHDGEMALDLADKLQKCKFVSFALDPSHSSPLPPPQGAAAQRAEVELIQDYQRIDANCQTIAGDRDQLRLRLLDVAIEKKVVSAAVESFHLGTRRPDVLQGVVEDARVGDISSLTSVAYHKASDFEISGDTQRAIRYALEVASNDPDVGKMVRPYLELAERASVPVGGEVSPKFDSSNLSDNVRNDGKAIAERIISRVKKGSQ